MESEARVQEFAASRNRLLAEYPERPKIVYLASCYRSARGEYGVREHIEAAAPVARAIWKLGLGCICPVMNTAYLGGCDIPTKVWLYGDFEMIRRCDGLVAHENAPDSLGAQKEIAVAFDAGVRIFHLPQDWRKLAAWAKKPKDKVLKGKATRDVVVEVAA